MNKKNTDSISENFTDLDSESIRMVKILIEQSMKYNIITDKISIMLVG